MPDHLSFYANYIKSLPFDESDYFTVDEYRVLLEIGGFIIRPLTDEEIERDRSLLLREAEYGLHMLKSHARVLLKALEFWKLRYEAMEQGWMDWTRQASLDSQLEAGLISPAEHASGGINPDEGYVSDQSSFSI